MNTILILDDEEKLRMLLARILRLEKYTVLEAGTAKEAFNILQRSDIQLFLCDVRLPDVYGVELTKTVKEQYPQIEIVLLTAFGTIADGVQAIKNGAYNYLVKGDDNDKIIPLVNEIFTKINARPIAKKRIAIDSFDSIIGTSDNFKQAISMAKKVAKTDTTVLLRGETGVGKEVFAQAIHQASSRNTKPFIALNCSALAKDILESELFGHKIGAFTGATKDKKGLIEEANGGTLFLDELGEMSLEVQAKLLRVLETQTFIKVGDTKAQKTDVRILAATNRDLQKEIELGHFRLDLYYRLSVFEIILPNLNERKDDIKALAIHFIEQLAAKMGLDTVPTMSSIFLQKLEQHTWKGNIRELKNVIERALILLENNVLTPDILPIEWQFAQANTTTTNLDLASVEKAHIQKVLDFTKGNKTETARLLDIGLTTLYRKIETYKLGN